jgi:hypothetical protein
MVKNCLGLHDVELYTVQAHMTLETGRWIGLYIFNTFRLPILPVYGGFPVKLITHIGNSA